MGKTVVGVPAAAHTCPCLFKAESANTRSGWEWPKGGVPPAAKPVASLTRSREARRAFSPPAAWASLWTSSLRSPGTRASTASPSTSNTSDLTIWLVWHPTARAASTAVLVPLGKVRISPSMSNASHLSTKRRVAAGRLAGSDTPLNLNKWAGGILGDVPDRDPIEEEHP